MRCETARKRHEPPWMNFMHPRAARSVSTAQSAGKLRMVPPVMHSDAVGRVVSAPPSGLSACNASPPGEPRMVFATRPRPPRAKQPPVDRKPAIAFAEPAIAGEAGGRTGGEQAQTPVSRGAPSTTGQLALTQVQRPPAKQPPRIDESPLRRSLSRRSLARREGGPEASRLRRL